MMDKMESLVARRTFEFVDPAAICSRPIEGRWIPGEKPGPSNSGAPEVQGGMAQYDVKAANLGDEEL